MEVERFWPLKGFSWAPLLFYVNRYTSLLAHVPVIVEYFLTTSNPADKVAVRFRCILWPSTVESFSCTDVCGHTVPPVVKSHD